MVEYHAPLVEPARHEVQVAAERVGDRLRLIVIEQTREVAPARIPPELDERGADHDPEDEPSEEPENLGRRRAAREGPCVEQRAEEDRQEAGLEELDLPAVTVPILTDMDERHVERP